MDFSKVLLVYSDDVERGTKILLLTALVLCIMVMLVLPIYLIGLPIAIIYMLTVEYFHGEFHLIRFIVNTIFYPFAIPANNYSLLL